MDKNNYIIAKKDLFDLFGRLSATYRVIVPYLVGERTDFDDFDPKRESSIELGGIRQSQPIKSFLNPSRELVFDRSQKDTRPLALAGVKGCDLASLKVQDFVFQEGDFKDPFYSESRANALIIASDCTYAKETCFCLAMEGAPYPKTYFDLSLSDVGDKFMVEVGSEKGSALIDDYKMFFRVNDGREVDTRDSNRDAISRQIKDFIEKRGTKNTSEIKGAVEKSYNNTEFWQDSSSTCVECGACNLVCPTCHCFLLFDEKASKGARRYKIWDSCLYKTFARVAGGANPRRHLYERLRNRFEKKFDFFPQMIDHVACTGCGRCIEACPGDIDIREVLKGAVEGKWKKPPHE